MRRLVLLIPFLLVPMGARAECFDISKSQPGELEGVLSARIFAGPPGYEDVDKGDTAEPGYVLRLAAPICLTGDDLTDPSAKFDEVQLVARDSTAKAMEALDGRAVHVRISDQLPAHTGHHHRPLVAWVDEISARNDVSANDGPAAATVRAFYLALGAGDGKRASAYVVEEKRRKGPFSARELGRFYGSLPEPLELVSVESAGTDRFTVRYRYGSKSGRCDGAAIVRTAKRGGRIFIQGIKAEGGC